MDEKKVKKIRKLPLYSLPKLYGWHLMPYQSIKDTGKIFQYFGANWWDLLIHGKLPLHKNKIEVKTKDAHAIIFINLGKDSLMMMNTETGDIYNIMAGKRSTVNNTFNKTIILQSSKEETEMHLTKIGSVWIILLQVEQIRDGKSQIKKSDLFTDFFLMSGIPDKEQYFSSMGIENMPAVKTKGWKIESNEDGNKGDFASLLLEQWEEVNPGKKKTIEKSIPPVVQWIWLRRDIKKKEYGPLKAVFYKFMDTWINRNPGFTFNIWTDNPSFTVPKKYKDIITIRGPEDIEKILDSVPSMIRKNIKYLYKNHPNVGARSDTLRQAILYVEGGVYGDINDSVCLASFEKILKSFDYIICIEPVVYVNNAIIAAHKKHKITENMLIWLAANAKEFVAEWNEFYVDAEQESKDDYIVSTTGPIALTWVLFGILEDKKNHLKNSVILPSCYFYGNYWMPESPGLWLKPTSIAAHYDRRDYLK